MLARCTTDVGSLGPIFIGLSIVNDVDSSISGNIEGGDVHH